MNINSTKQGGKAVWVSVVMPVYNVEDYLDECLAKTLNQTLREIEVICIDDGSTDGSLAILKRHAQMDSRVKIVCQANQGAGKARNVGLQMAQGEFVAFMDPDDFYPSPDTLRHMYDAATANGVDICGGSLNQIKWNELITNPKLFEDGYSFASDGLVSYGDYQFDYGYWRFLYRREFLKKNGISFPDYRRQQDPPFMVRAFCLAERFYALKEPTYVYRLSHKTVTWNERKAYDLFCGVDDVLQMAEEFGYERLFGRVVRRMNAWTYRTACAEMLKFTSVRDNVLKVLARIHRCKWFAGIKDFEFDDIFKAVEASRDNGIVVSVIVPVYNVKKYVARCLNSLLAQTFPWMEILCVNDGATDGSRRILEQYAEKDRRVKILDKPNGGLSSARNWGMDRAVGSLVSFIDPDDWIAPETYDLAVARMHGKIDIVNWGMELVADGVREDSENMIAGRDYHQIRVVGEKTLTGDVIKMATYTACNKLYKKELLEKYNIRFVEGRLFEDNDFTIIYFVHCRHAWFLDKYLYYYVQRPNSIMDKVRARESEKTIDQLYIFDSFYHHLGRNGLLTKYRTLVASRYLIHLRAAYKYAPENCRKKIRETASLLASSYAPSLFWQNVIEKLRRREYSAIPELNEIVVSLTSYPGRIRTVHKTIESIIRQTLKPDRIVLWLASRQFHKREKSLPKTLRSLLGRNLEVRWWKDIRSYKKIIPALREFPESIIVTIDDDLIYHPEMLSRLYAAYKKDCRSVHCHRSYRIVMSGRDIVPYKEWRFGVHEEPSYLTFPTFGAGAIFPPHCFRAEVFNEASFMKFAPRADDVWLWAMLVLSGRKMHLITDNISRLVEVEGSQDQCLWKDNVTKGGNDKQLKAVLSHYPEVKRRILRTVAFSGVKLPFSCIQSSISVVWHLIGLERKSIRHLLFQLQAWRIDLQNAGAGNDLAVFGMSGFCNVSQMNWLKESQGRGFMISGGRLESRFSVRCKGNGTLVVHLMGADRKENGVRVPFYVDALSFAVDGKERLRGAHTVWHDDRVRLSIPVQDGQTLSFRLRTRPHRYARQDLAHKIQLLCNGNLSAAELDRIMSDRLILSFVQDGDRKAVLRNAFAWIEDKIVGGVMCLRENGWRYTLLHSGEKASGLVAAICHRIANGRSRKPLPRCVYSLLNDWRVECRHELSEDASLHELDVAGGEVNVLTPAWIADDESKGRLVVGWTRSAHFLVRCAGGGIVRFDLCNGRHALAGKSLPTFVEYTNFFVNGVDMLDGNVAVGPTGGPRVRIQVKDGDVLRVEVRTIPYQYEKSALQDLLLAVISRKNMSQRDVERLMEDGRIKAFLK